MLVVFLISSFICADNATAALTSFETDDFSGSGVCAFCHSRLTDKAGSDVSNDAQWRSTMMANASKDPLWQAKISAEVALVAGMENGFALGQIIQEKCSRCHMGMARYQALTDGTPKDQIFVLEDNAGFLGFLDRNHYLHEAAMDGVSCTLCHQIISDNLGSKDSFTGLYEIDTNTVSPNRILYGPYKNPLRNPMQRNTGFWPTDHASGNQLGDSAHCGSCHTLYTPALSVHGKKLKDFPEQTTYLEWKHSQFKQTCQDCHLPHAEGAVVISNRPRRLAARSPFGQHHYVGSNSFMVNLLKTNAADLGVTADVTHLDATISRTLYQLQKNTATVAAEALLSDGLLTVTVDVTNLAGHKFPSGLPSRRAWLSVTVADIYGNTLFESGAPLADGRISGNNAAVDPQTFEPHYTMINSTDQVQIYEPVMLNYEGEVTYTLLRAHDYIKDNRLLPAGFNKGTAPRDIAVYGVAETDDDFIGGSDRVVYEISGILAQPANVTVTVKLLFQTLSYPFIEDLGSIETDKVVSFMALYNREKNDPIVIDFIEITPTQSY